MALAILLLNLIGAGLNAGVYAADGHPYSLGLGVVNALIFLHWAMQEASGRHD